MIIIWAFISFEGTNENQYGFACNKSPSKDSIWDYHFRLTVIMSAQQYPNLLRLVSAALGWSGKDDLQMDYKISSYMPKWSFIQQFYRFFDHQYLWKKIIRPLGSLETDANCETTPFGWARSGIPSQH